ncbi:pyrroline-5-carboxylate reductase 3 isoform X2 [Anabrus simplex]|uniref:pyrroline-5-carboxylate reductase 3 isoform X2 n=1 Tax=Anabrus simplex TaxID=316456 RepID=UPI0035A2AB1F
MAADGNGIVSGNIGFIGAGNMAWAIGGGLIKSGNIKASQIFVSAPTEGHLGMWREVGAHTTHLNGEVVEKSDTIFLAMKPHYLDAALEDVRKTLSKPLSGKLFVSILAGVKLSVLQDKVNAVVSNARVVRVMPNTPVMVGSGCSVFCGGRTATSHDMEVVRQILSAGGICEQIPESMMDAVGGLSGCGPAYVYLMIEALSDGAVKMGVPRAMATQFAAQTVLGAANMVLQTGKHPGQLKDEVCSPGGTTITGIHAMEKGRVRCALMDAVEAATMKSMELGK